MSNEKDHNNSDSNTLSPHTSSKDIRFTFWPWIIGCNMQHSTHLRSTKKTGKQIWIPLMKFCVEKSSKIPGQPWVYGIRSTINPLDMVWSLILKYDELIELGPQLNIELS